MTNEDLKLMREKNKRTEVLKIGEAIEMYKQHPAVKNKTGVMYEFDKKSMMIYYIVQSLL